MHIVYVSWEYPPQFGGGIGTFVQAIARTLIARGHCITVLTITDNKYPSRDRQDGVSVVRVPFLSASGPDPIASLRHWQNRSDALSSLLRKMIRNDDVDVIEFGDYRGEGVTFMGTVPPEQRPVCVLRLHTPVAVLHRYNPSRPRYQVLEEYEHQAVRMADQLVSPSMALAREMQQLVPGIGEIELLPYPADPTFLDYDIDATPPSTDEVLYVGRLEERKGVQTLIDAAVPFLDECPDATLCMIGGDTLLDSANPSVKRVLVDKIPRRLRDRIEMPGPIPRERLIERYLRARFCVFPSHFENFPNTCLEAMSLGRCVIGTTNSGMAEMIRDGVSGVIVESANVQQLGDAMTRLFKAPQDERDRMGLAARQRMVDAYLPDRIAQQIEDQYRKYMTAHGRHQSKTKRVPRSEPRVAVVVPCYNHGKFLPETLESIRAQTYPHVDVVVVDDGSTDAETLEALTAISDQGTRVIRQENQGLVAARNTGVRATDAEFFLPLDADDRIEPRFVESLLRPMLENPELGYCYSYARFFDAAEGVWECPVYDPRRLLVENLSTASAIVRREAYDQVGGYSADMIHGFEDWDFWLALLSVGYHGRLVPEPLFLYRKHADGSMLSHTQQHRSEMMHKMIEHHRSLFATMLESSLVGKDTMFFDAHMRGAAPAAASNAGTTPGPQDDEIYQKIRAQAELDYIENSRFWKTLQRMKRVPPYRWIAAAVHGHGWQNGLENPDPRENLRGIKASRVYRMIGLIKRTPIYKLYARRKYGPDLDSPRS